MNIQQSLKISTKKLNLSNIPSSALDAEVLLLETLNRNRCEKLDKSWLYVNNNYELNKNEKKLFDSFIDQRRKHKPIAYIINRKEFFGFNFYVDENVLIPRPETEFIVEEVLKIMKNNNDDKIDIIDIGTGSGCIIISILNKLKEEIIENAYANDISPKTIKIAKRNAKEYNLDKKIKFITNDLGKFLDNLNEKNIYNSNRLIITANLPYIKSDDYKTLSKDIKKHEPKIALIAGKNGLVLIEKLIKSILKIKKKHKKKIHVFIEADPSQISKIIAVTSEELDKANIKIIKDLSGKERVVLLSYC